MKSKIFKCSCLDLAHIFEVNKDSLHEGGVDFVIKLNRQPTLWRRLKVAINYMRGKEGSSWDWDFDAVALNKEQKQELVDFLNEASPR